MTYRERELLEAAKRGEQRDDTGVSDEHLVAETYIRHQGPTTAARVFPAPAPGQGICLVCERPLTTGPVTLVPIGSSDPEEQAKMREGKWVSARAVIVHAACAGREYQPEGDR